ncbi:MAG: hypothetical protein KAW12_11080 [Candidatus Aminicenantes bacterium]|nr:hypothetical protein [Candidatus Aminicenantes bacterium]
MNIENSKKLEIISNLSFVPTDKLGEINDFIQYIMYKNKVKKKKPLSVWGIWENKGFEEIDVEKELAILCREVRDNLDRKEF